MMPTATGSLPTPTVAATVGYARRRRNNAHSNGVVPHRDRGRHRGAGGVDHRNIVGGQIRDVGVFPVRRDGDQRGAIACFPSGATATPLGLVPTGIAAASTVLVAVSIAETVLVAEFVT